MATTAPASDWLLDPSVTFITHGTFGACPRPVLELQSQLREQIEREPVKFLDYGLERRLDEARASLAAYLGAQAFDVSFQPNATTGVNTVLHSLDLRPGDEILTTDHEYNACANAARAAAAAAGARVLIASVPFPIASPDEVVEAIVGAATPRTRLAMLSHVTSPTAVIFPVARVAAALAERGIETLVDGAHSPGMVPIDLDELARAGVAYYAGNGHKWLCAPKGSGFLWVRRDRQSMIRPLVVSHAANSPRTERSYFIQAADWTGTLDPTPYLCMPAAIEYMAGVLPGGWPALRAANHRLVIEARDLLCATLGTAPPAPDEMLGSMAAIRLPDGLEPAAPTVDPEAPAASTYGQDELHDLLIAREGIEVPVYLWPPVPQAERSTLRLLRLSAQVYNRLADYERLAQALHDLVGAPGA